MLSVCLTSIRTLQSFGRPECESLSTSEMLMTLVSRVV